jgi:hypothetical protein
MIVTLPYGDVVLPTDDAVALMKIFEKAEKYRCKYNGDKGTTHHVFSMEDQLSLRLISNDTYAMYKLAGKPED